MRCKRVRDLISPYIDEMTDEKETLLVEEHLAVCSSCLLMANNMLLLRRAMANMNSPQAPVGFVEDVLRRLQDEPPPDKPWMADMSSKIRSLVPRGVGGRKKGDLIRFYRWRKKTLE